MSDMTNDEEARLDQLDPAAHPASDAAAFRRIITARKNLEKAQAELQAAVAAAREAGDSWTVIGAALDVTKQDRRDGTWREKMSRIDDLIETEAAAAETASLPDDDLEEVAAANAASSADDESAEWTADDGAQATGTATMIVRLPVRAIAALKIAAEHEGVGATVLARRWITERLAQSPAVLSAPAEHAR